MCCVKKHPAAKSPTKQPLSTTLPVLGLQIVAKPWEEGKLIGMAYNFEQATKVRKPPKL
jgi:Asp-tRNA(Asn)/Glu-tRNA(Gln) amidotransferase A subunit family amidase